MGITPPDYMKVDFFAIRPSSAPNQMPFSHPHALATTDYLDGSFDDTLQTWVDSKARVHDGMEKYMRFQQSLKQTVDFDDVRVRDVSEWAELAEYLKAEHGFLDLDRSSQVSRHINFVSSCACLYHLFSHTP